MRDLESANGTFVNDRPVKEASVHAGDRLRLGATLIDVRDPSSRASGTKTGTVMLNDAAGIESVIERRIEPSSLEWLSTSTHASDAQLALLQRAQRHLSVLHRVSEALSKARTMETLSAATLHAILEVLPADRTALVLRRQDPSNRQPEVAAARTRAASPDEPFSVSRTLVSDVIARGLSVFAHDASSDARFSAGQSVIGQHVRSVMCVPLKDGRSGARRALRGQLERCGPVQRGGPRTARGNRQSGRGGSAPCATDG